MSAAWLAIVVVAFADPPPTFRGDVAPLFAKYGCNQGACHGALSGKGGFRLSLRGDDPIFDYASIAREEFGRRIDLVEPASSLLIAKPTGGLPHEGGVRFAADSAPAKAIAAWIAAGARDEKIARVVKLEVTPAAKVLAPRTTREAVSVVAVLEDGARRPVTHLSAFEVDDPTKATVTHAGSVEAKRPTDVTVAVRYRNARGVARLTFPPDRPDYKPPKTENPIDTAIARKLADIRTPPTNTCDDSVFVRRAYLSVAGVLPTAAEAKAFLQDTRPDKRRRLAEALVARPEFADFWALKWADVLRNERKTMGVKGSQIFTDWLRKQAAEDAPADALARQLIAGVGSTWTNPPASFHRTNRDPTVAAETAGQVFWGVRIQCARCHNHPFDVWTQDDFYGFSAYFANVKRKEIDNKRKDGLDSHNITGDVVVSAEGKAQYKHPTTGKMVDPKPLGAAAGKPVEKNLEAAADWLTKHPQFSRNFANRVWYHLMGRGVVDGPDDFRDSNPPANAELLEALTERFDAHGKRIKPLVVEILSSAAFGRESAAARDELATANFAHYLLRPLPAEVLLDAVSQVLERPESFPDRPANIRAVQAADGNAGNDFLRAFGKPDRLLTCECERSSTATLAQAFQMINGPSVRRKLVEKDNRLGRLLAAKATDAAILEELTLAALARFPTSAERTLANDHLKASKDRRQAWEDLAWAILNSKEFLLLR